MRSIALMVCLGLATSAMPAHAARLAGYSCVSTRIVCARAPCFSIRCTAPGRPACRQAFMGNGRKITQCDR